MAARVASNSEPLSPRPGRGRIQLKHYLLIAAAAAVHTASSCEPAPAGATDGADGLALFDQRITPTRCPVKGPDPGCLRTEWGSSRLDCQNIPCRPLRSRLFGNFRDAATGPLLTQRSQPACGKLLVKMQQMEAPGAVLIRVSVS